MIRNLSMLRIHVCFMIALCKAAELRRPEHRKALKMANNPPIQNTRHWTAGHFVRPPWPANAIPARLLLPAALLMAFACLGMAAFAPKALSESLIWLACRANCTALGWPAIEWGPWIGFLASAVAIALLGRASFDVFHEARGRRHLPTTKALFTAGGLICVAVMTFAPSNTPDFIDQVVRDTSLRAAGMPTLPSPNAQAIPLTPGR